MEEFEFVEKAKKHIKTIHDRIISSDPEYVLDSLAGATQKLEMAFPGTGHFLMEFIQNSDDAKSNSMKIEITEKAVIICNDGTAFTELDVTSICKIGRSSKNLIEGIGYLGVGFKSVFLISDSAHIYSGSYRFKFEKSHWGADSENIPWRIIPLWIENPLDTQNERWNTEFILNLSDKVGNGQIHALESEISSDRLNNRILLFINNLENITIRNAMNGKIRKIVKSNYSQKEDYDICSIKEYENDNLISEDSWLVFRKKVKVTDNAHNSLKTEDNRRKITEREVLVAFKLDRDGNLMIEDKGTAHMGVFSFLPLREVRSGLNFLVQSDFITTTGRTAIDEESLWNEWLINEIFDLITKKCIPVFLSDQKWIQNYTTVLYSSFGGNAFFDKHLRKRLNSYLEDKPVLFDDNNEKSKSSELIELNNEMQELFSEEDTKLLYPKLRKMHRQCIPHKGLNVKKGPSSISEFLKSDKSQELFNSKAKDGDINWFKRFYLMLAEKYTLQYFEKKFTSPNVAAKFFDKFWDAMGNCENKIMLTDDFKLAVISESYIKSEKIKIPDNLKVNFKIVHPELAGSEGFKAFLEKLNMERHSSSTQKELMELTDKDVINKIIIEKLAKMDEDKWSILSDSEKMDEIKTIKECYSFYKYGNKSFNQDLSYITVPSESGKWLKPKELFFGNKYPPRDHELETLVDEKIYDHDDIDFVSSEFISGEEENEIKEWVAFFMHLGVDSLIKASEENSRLRYIVSEIGKGIALKYETDNKRRPKPLESNKPGYDIVSESPEGRRRLIEVKATKLSGDPRIKDAQVKALRKDIKDYYIYYVINSLKSPVLYIDNGETVYDIITGGGDITLSAKKLMERAEDRYYFFKQTS